MKKKIEGELISIAHRLLKLNNYKETAQLHDEVKKLYEQLTVLRFYEENFELVTNEIPETVFEEKLEKTVVGVIEVDEDEVDEVEFTAPAHIQEMEEEILRLNPIIDDLSYLFNIGTVEERKELQGKISKLGWAVYQMKHCC